MEKKMTRNEKLKALFNYTKLDCFEYQDFDTYDELIEDLRTQIIEYEIIYHSKAMEYLSNNDASLQESIYIAVEYGYELKNVNSELLATFLSQKLLNEELSSIEGGIKEIYAESEE